MAPPVVEVEAEPPPRQQEQPGPSALCQECGKVAPKYTCPACAQRTCSLACVRAHKARMGCDGKRAIKFVAMEDFGDREMFRDIAFLDDAKRVCDVAHRHRPTPPRRVLPPFLKSLRFQARRRGVRLLFLQPGMKMRRENSTCFHKAKDRFSWRVEWRFRDADPAAVVTDDRLDDRAVIRDVLERAAAATGGVSGGVDGLRVFLQRPKNRGDEVGGDELDVGATLADALCGKTVVEFPILHVTRTDMTASAAGDRSDAPAATNAGDAM